MVSLAVMLLFLIIPAAAASQPGGGAGDTGAWSVAVLDFGTEEVPAELGRAAAESLSMYLGETGELAVFDMREVRAAAGEVMGGAGAEAEAGHICREAGCAVATGERLGANSVIIGTVSEFGQILTITIEAYNVFSGDLSGTWSAESFGGREDMPGVARHLADQVLDVKAGLRKGGRVTPEIARAEEEAAAANFEASFTLGAGLAVLGRTEDKLKCMVTDTSSVCSESRVDVKWLVNVGFYGRLRSSRLVFGFRGGGMYAETERDLDVAEAAADDFSHYHDKGFHFYLYPILGYMIMESGGNNLLAYGGAGYRNFTDKTGVSSTFAALGLAAQISKVNLEIVYWRCSDSEKLMQNLVTAGIGFGTGF
jgi:hypothetical protein